jgi:hypothetical protein
MHPGYSGLVAIAERELGLVERGDLESLPALWDERRALVTGLPPVPPRDARPYLERAAELQGRVTALLEDRMGTTGAELRRLVRGRAVMNSYAPQVRRQLLVDAAG